MQGQPLILLRLKLMYGLIAHEKGRRWLLWSLQITIYEVEEKVILCLSLFLRLLRLLDQLK